MLTWSWVATGLQTKTTNLSCRLLLSTSAVAIYCCYLAQKTGNLVCYCQSTKAKATLWSVDLRGIKLLEHATKVVERIFEHR